MAYPTVLRNAHDCPPTPPFVFCLCSSPSATLNMRDRRLTFLNHFPLHPIFHHLPASFLLTELRCVVLQPCLACLVVPSTTTITTTFFFFSFSSSFSPITNRQYSHFAPPSYGRCCGMFCRMQTRTNCSRERTAVRTSEPLAPISFFDCCPCLDTRPCEHVRDSRMRSNLVST